MVVKRPEKKETLAIKREEKIRSRFYLRKRFSDFAPSQWVERGEGLGLIALFILNFILLLPFFGYEDRINRFSAPLIPTLASATSFLIPFSYGIRVWILVFIILLPHSLYWMMKTISGRKLTGFLAALIVSLPVGIFLPTRVNLGLLGGDGAQVASLTFIPVVCIFLLWFLRGGKFWIGVLASAGVTLVALTSPLGTTVLLVFMGVITFSEVLLGWGRLKILRFLTVMILAIGFSAFWYNPKMAILILMSPQGQLIRQTFSNLLPISFFVLPVLGVFGFLLFENRPHLQPMFIAFFLMIGFGLFSLGAGVATAVPSRFIPALGVSVAFFLGNFVVWLMSFLRISAKLDRFRIPAWRRQLMASGLLGLVLIIICLINIFSGNRLRELEKGWVLGLTSDQTVGIWEIREKMNFFESLIGFGVTGLTFWLVFLLRDNLKRAREELKQEGKERN